MAALLMLSLWGLAGCVESHCFEARDCASPRICGPEGRCVYECEAASDCSAGFACVGHRCKPAPAGPLVCPADMVGVADIFCVDRYEASRPDANAAKAGEESTGARSVAGVLPWQVPDNASAAQACEAVGKRLCNAQEWQVACAGPDETSYAYGDDYEPATCNGIDTYGRESFHLMPTGAFPACTNEWGAFDLNGNVWEHVANGSDRTVRGGAYNCSDSAAYQRCSYVPGSWVPGAVGFRCCLTPAGRPDAGSIVHRPDAAPRDASGDAVPVEGGCLTEDVPQFPDRAARDAAPPVDAAPRLDTSPGPDTAPRPDARPADAGPDAAPSPCPPDMVPTPRVCIDRYEASRSDATEAFPGVAAVASARVGVIPWFPVTLPQARAACATMGKRLCQPDEWFEACHGPAMTTYTYGNAFDPVICNSIDTYCDCASPACAGVATCPYPHCYNEPSPDGQGGPCGAHPHVMPTGSFPECTDAYGAFDVNGNVWEIVDSADGTEHFRGGAYNCRDSELLHRCDYDTSNVTAKGFRCCRDLGP